MAFFSAACSIVTFHFIFCAFIVLSMFLLFLCVLLLLTNVINDDDDDWLLSCLLLTDCDSCKTP